MQSYDTTNVKSHQNIKKKLIASTYDIDDRRLSEVRLYESCDMGLLRNWNPLKDQELINSKVQQYNQTIKYPTQSLMYYASIHRKRKKPSSKLNII